MCSLPGSTLYVPAGWRGAIDDYGTVHLQDEGVGAVTLDPIELQVLTGALRAACEEMGAALIRSAHSPNIKERRDCSTALFDAHGQMVMQAEHIPVHLGSMPAAVAAVLGEDHSEGRSWVLNDPFAGGTHLPDITLITPVLGRAGDRPPIGFAVSRAHHADVGGRVPGSMPADSRTLAEEGVVISPRPATPEEIERLVARMRQPQERRADLRAQLAANRIGAQRLRELAARVGVARLRRGWTRCSTTPSGAPAPAWRRCPTGCTWRRTCWRRSRATSCCACAPRWRASGCCSTSPAAPPSTPATSTARSR